MFFVFSAAKRYAEEDKIPVYIGGIFAGYDPIRRFSYFDFPFCNTTISSPKSIGDRFVDNTMYAFPVQLKYLIPSEEIICKTTIDWDNIDIMDKMISEKYMMQLYIDKLSQYIRIGKRSKQSKFIYTQYSIVAHYCNSKIISVDINSRNPQEILEDTTIQFSISTEWKPTDKTNRWEKYQDIQFFKGKWHLYTLINQAILLFILVIILISVFKDMMHSPLPDNSETEPLINRSWVSLRNDFFSAPKNSALLSIFLGLGVEFLVSLLIIFSMNVTWRFKFGIHSQISVFLFAFSFGSFFGGYFQAGFFKQWNNSTDWKKYLFIFSIITPFFAYILYFRKLGFVLLSLIIYLPLSYIGGNYGRNSFIFPEPTVPSIAQPYVTKLPFHLQKTFLAIIISIISSSSILLEVYYILNSIWQYKYYFTWTWLFVSFGLTLFVSAISNSIGIMIRLKQYLCFNDWGWISFTNSASLSIAIFVYCIYFMKTQLRLDNYIYIIDFLSLSFKISAAFSLADGAFSYIFVHILGLVLYETQKID